jgi:hypothetical protein
MNAQKVASLYLEIMHVSEWCTMCAASSLATGGDAFAAATAGTSSYAAAAAAAAGPSSSTASQAAGAAALARAQQQQQQAAAAGYAVCWGDLPPDVRSTVLSQLSPSDLARAASTCAEFRDWANAMRAHVSVLTQ